MKKIRLIVQGETISGKYVKKTVHLPLGEKKAGVDRLKEAGLEVVIRDNKVHLDNVVFGSVAEKVGLDFDWEVLSIEKPSERWPKQLMFIPALTLLGWLAWWQRRRKLSKNQHSYLMLKFQECALRPLFCNTQD